MNKIENRLTMKSHPFALTLNYLNHKNISKVNHLNHVCNSEGGGSGNNMISF